MAKDTKNISSDDMESINNRDKTETTDSEINVESIETVTPASTKREENPFSFKHFLKRDSSINANSTSNHTITTNSINHSLSTSNINNGNTETNECPSSANTSSPSKSATTSSLSQNATGARPKIPQFQSVNTLAMESKMKRSPRFPSFDSQSSLSELGGSGGGGGGSSSNDDKWSMTNLLHSQSNSSFNADFVSDPVQRSYSTYDIELPPMTLSPKFERDQQQQPRSIHNNSPTTNSRDDSLTSNSGNLISVGHRLATAEFSAALPDFVQDHLVMEQWYNTMSGNGSPSSVDFDQLPDFAVNNIESDFSSRDRSSRQNDIPFDLTFSSTTSHQRSRTPIRRTSPTILPLDLPDNSTMSLPGGRYGRRSDIQPDITTTDSTGLYHYHHQNLDVANRDGVEKIQTLPDFLSDGPARLNNNNNNNNNNSGQDHIPHFNSPDDHLHSHIQNNSSMSRLTHENSRLRDELEDCRRIMLEQTRQINDLEAKLAETRCKESQYNATLAHSMEQVEENLDRSNKRAAAAQTAANKLKTQVKQLTAEVESLRRENDTLKEETGGAVGGAAGSNVRRPNRLAPQAQHLSQELRLAASTAENNLRQLLTGVDNLRIMAATLESLNDVVAPPINPNIVGTTIITESDFLSDSDENDFTGPAL